MTVVKFLCKVPRNFIFSDKNKIIKWGDPLALNLDKKIKKLFNRQSHLKKTGEINTKDYFNNQHVGNMQVGFSFQSSSKPMTT